MLAVKEFYTHRPTEAAPGQPRRRAAGSVRRRKGTWARAFTVASAGKAGQGRASRRAGLGQALGWEASPVTSPGRCGTGDCVPDIRSLIKWGGWRCGLGLGVCTLKVYSQVSAGHLQELAGPEEAASPSGPANPRGVKASQNTEQKTVTAQPPLPAPGFLSPRICLVCAFHISATTRHMSLFSVFAHVTMLHSCL